MNTTTLRLRPIALAAIFAASVVSSGTSFGQTTATTDPVGYYTLSAAGASDTVLSLPMVRDAVFAGTIDSGVGNITANSFRALAGTVSPAWSTAPKQFVYAAGSQPLTYYVEFTSGALKGLYYKIVDNTANTLTLDMEGDSLTLHPLPGAPTATLAAGDSFKIRPYWRIKDVFENNGTPIIDSRPDFDTPRDDVLIPNYVTVGQNKGANVTYFHVNSVEDGVGWRTFTTGAADKGDDILRPNEAFVLRRRNAQALSITNLGSVQMIRSIAFIPGGNGTSGNDTYISINRPSAVSLNLSGLRTADQATSLIKDSVDGDNPGDRLLAFTPGTGFNRAPSRTYYFLAGVGGGWRLFPNDVTDVGNTTLEPGTAYIVRKTSQNAGRDWINEPNY